MKIGIGVTGSIAAYRSPDFVKLLKDRGHETRVILTHSASELVSARVLETVSGNPVALADPFGPGHASTDHIEFARWADRFVVYAGSADFLARYAGGFASDFLNLQLLAARAPVWIAPAMNPAMWEHPAVQANVARLRERGVRFVGPIAGTVACGETGIGHIAALEEIADAVLQRSGSLEGERSESLKGRRILISAGPMRTPLDPVRYVQNRSSGRMGLALAREARARGAEVDVLLGPVPDAIAGEFERTASKVERYVGPAEYGDKLPGLFSECDVFLSLAAVLDFEVEAQPAKIERHELARMPELRTAIRPVPDFVAAMAERRKPGQKVIAFAAESGSPAALVERAREKLRKKKVDLIVANPVADGVGPEAASNEVWVLSGDSAPVHLGPALKDELAGPLLSALF